MISTHPLHDEFDFATHHITHYFHEEREWRSNTPRAFA